MKKPGICLVYAKSSSFSGQSAAAETLERLLKDAGWKTRHLQLPAFDREKSTFFAWPCYLAKLVFTWIKAPFLAFDRPIPYVAPGQTLSGLVRDAVPYFLLCIFGCRRGLGALHGSLCTEWTDYKRPDARLFLLIMKSARAIAVLGPGHTGKLVEMGIPETRIHIVPNTVDIDAVEPEFIREKRTTNPVVITFFSLLVDAKGYPEFLEAIELLSGKVANGQIEAILCGPLTSTAISDRFASTEQARSFIESKLQSINRSKTIPIQWIEGARGNRKVELLRKTHILVLPTRYRNEVQPLAIIEAMASGAAVVTSKTGQIFSSFGDCCEYVPHSDPQNLAVALQKLADDPEHRQKLAQLGLLKFHSDFSNASHLSKWLAILEG